MLIQQLLHGNFDPAFILSWLVAVTIALTVHEFAHAKVADMAGDGTPRAMGRVSLNPIDHYDPIGTTMIVLFGIGWGKPVPVNPTNFGHPRRDDALVALAGPGSNIVMAVLFAVPLRFGFAGEYGQVLELIVLINLFLAFFNLIPVFPLDGSHILQAILPYEKARSYSSFMQRYGMLLLILIIVTPVLNLLVVIPAQLLYHLLTGVLLLF
ncbi:MAG: site-2 protease family protein [Armatimonadetes bacterium]|nr:site-2 protease family protein [Armatimonadota bacterium]